MASLSVPVRTVVPSIHPSSSTAVACTRLGLHYGCCHYFRQPPFRLLVHAHAGHPRGEACPRPCLSSERLGSIGTGDRKGRPYGNRKRWKMEHCPCSFRHQRRGRTADCHGVFRECCVPQIDSGRGDSVVDHDPRCLLGVVPPAIRKRGPVVRLERGNAELVPVHRSARADGVQGNLVVLPKQHTVDRLDEHGARM